MTTHMPRVFTHAIIKLRNHAPGAPCCPETSHAVPTCRALENPMRRRLSRTTSRQTTPTGTSQAASTQLPRASAYPTMHAKSSAKSPCARRKCTNTRTGSHMRLRETAQPSVALPTRLPHQQMTPSVTP